MPPGAKRKAKVTVEGFSSIRRGQSLMLPTTTTTNARGRTTTTRGFNTQQARRIVGDSGVRSLRMDLYAQAMDRTGSNVSSTVHSSGAVQVKGRKRSLNKPRRK